MSGDVLTREAPRPQKVYYDELSVGHIKADEETVWCGFDLWPLIEKDVPAMAAVNWCPSCLRSAGGVGEP